MKSFLIMFLLVVYQPSTVFAEEKCNIFLGDTIESYVDLDTVFLAEKTAKFCEGYYLGLTIATQEQMQELEEEKEKDHTNKALARLYEKASEREEGYGDLAREFGVRKKKLQKILKKGLK